MSSCVCVRGACVCVCVCLCEFVLVAKSRSGFRFMERATRWRMLYFITVGVTLSTVANPLSPFSGGRALQSVLPSETEANQNKQLG